MLIKKPYWVDENTWVCPKHLPPPRLPAQVEQCWYGCKNVRPEGRPLPVQVKPIQAVPNGMTCAWKECSEAAQGKSKYCSRNCSNKNARWRHKMRKAA